MSRRPAAITMLALALVLVAGPAAAAPTVPQVTDACGDAGIWGEWNGDAMEFEESQPYLDVASGHVAGRYDQAGGFTGFTAAISVCGDVSADEGGYSISWGYGDGCYSTVSWTLAARERPEGTGIYGGIQAAAGPHPRLTEDCYREPTSPLDSGVDTVYSVDLPADTVVFEGDTLTFTVATALLPEAAAPRLAPGTAWTNISVVSMDQGPSMWAGYVDSQGNRGNLFVRTDFAFGDAGYIVGEDAGA